MGVYVEERSFVIEDCPLGWGIYEDLIENIQRNYNEFGFCFKAIVTQQMGGRNTLEVNYKVGREKTIGFSGFRIGLDSGNLYLNTVPFEDNVLLIEYPYKGCSDLKCSVDRFVSAVERFKLTGKPEDFLKEIRYQDMGSILRRTFSKDRDNDGGKQFTNWCNLIRMEGKKLAKYIQMAMARSNIVGTNESFSGRASDFVGCVPSIDISGSSIKDDWKRIWFESIPQFTLEKADLNKDEYIKNIKAYQLEDILDGADIPTEDRSSEGLKDLGVSDLINARELKALSTVASRAYPKGVENTFDLSDRYFYDESRDNTNDVSITIKSQTEILKKISNKIKNLF